MNENELVETLIDSGVLTESSDGAVQLSSGFESTVASYEEMLPDGDHLSDELEAVGTPSDRIAGLLTVADEDPEFVATYLALRSTVDAMSFTESIQVTILLDQFSEADYATDGSPDPFFPIRGERLPAMLTIFPITVVYVWREQCPDCDEMRKALEAVFEADHDHVTLFSVYGPECAEMLEERYEVVGGPTTLFVVDSAIDARLQGAHVEEVVEREVDNSLTTAEMRGVL